MNFKFNVPGTKRKELAKEIGSWLAVEVKYMGAPSFAYEVGGVRIEKDGTAAFPKVQNPETTESLLEHLYDEGFESEMLTEGETEQTAPTGINIQIPFENVNVGNLTNLLESKDCLIKKALGISDTRIELHEDSVSFPWFGTDKDADEQKAYTLFIARLCELSKKRMRINKVEHDVKSEKYAFRCFLLSLGFIGKEYKETRKILLRNLEGSSAFKNGRKDECDD